MASHSILHHFLNKSNLYTKIILTTLLVLTMLLFAGYFYDQVNNKDQLQSQANTYNNLDVNISSYLATPSDDSVNTSQISNSGEIILAGGSNDLASMVSQLNSKFGTNLTLTNPADKGYILILSSNGQSVIDFISNVDYILDSAFNRSTQRLITIDSIGKIDIIDTLTWNISESYQAPVGSKTARVRVDVSEDGIVAGLNRGRVTVFDTTTKQEIGSFAPVGKLIMDLAMTEDTNDIVVVGETQKDGPPCRQYRAGWMRSYQYSGQLNWTNYDWTREQVSQHCADAMPIVVSMGEDNLIYMASESAGGNTIFAKDPRNLDKYILTKYDQFNDPYNTASNHITFYGAYEPSTGNIIKGQMMLSRLLDGRGNTIKPKSIEVDAQGIIYLAGQTFSNFPDRVYMSGADKGVVRQSINGQLIANYAGGEGFVSKISSDLKARLITTSFTGELGNSDFNTIAVYKDLVAAGGLVSRGQQITFNSLQDRNLANDGFFVSWGSFDSSGQTVTSSTGTSTSTPVIDNSSSQTQVNNTSSQTSTTSSVNTTSNDNTTSQSDTTSSTPPLVDANCQQSRPCIIFEEELYFSPTKSNPSKYGEADLVAGVQQLPIADTVQTCKVLARKYASNDTYLDITESIPSTNTLCSGRVKATDQKFNQYDLKFEIITTSGNYFVSYNSYFLKLGAVGLVSINATQ